jgi:BMFP domain-containing protein YqiC
MSLFSRLFGKRKPSKHDQIMSKLSTLETQITEVLTNQREANAEIRAKLDSLNSRIAELEASLGDVDIPEAAQTALDAAKAESKALADIIPGSPTPPGNP